MGRDLTEAMTTVLRAFPDDWISLMTIRSRAGFDGMGKAGAFTGIVRVLGERGLVEPKGPAWYGRWRRTADGRRALAEGRDNG